MFSDLMTNKTSPLFLIPVKTHYTYMYFLFPFLYLGVLDFLPFCIVKESNFFPRKLQARALVNDLLDFECSIMVFDCFSASSREDDTCSL